MRAILASFADRENEPSARSNLIYPCQCFAKELWNAICINKRVISHGHPLQLKDLKCCYCSVLLCYRFSSFIASTIAIVSTLTRVTRMRRSITFSLWSAKR
jgi:hypothetical protein